MTAERLVLPPLSEERHVYLSGPMGAGKSTLARMLGAQLGRPSIDLDARIEAAAGTTVATLFRERGEAAFRALEAELAEKIAQEAPPSVVALGGGTVVDAHVRRTLVATGQLITLRAAPAVLAARVSGSDRPLLSGHDAAHRLAALLHERAPAYAEAHAVIDADGSPEDVLARLLAVVAEAPILIPLGARSYRARFGPLEHAASELHGTGALVIADASTATYGRRLAGALRCRAELVTIEAGEAQKHVGTLAKLWDAAAAFGLDREGFFVAVGGGVLGDLTGFAAATWMRGVRWAALPTTLLAMADSAIGGKTAIDHGGGKNLVGAFHQPRLVQIDVGTLATLPVAERRAGLAEVVKCAWIAGEAAVRALEHDAAALDAGEPEAIARAVRLAARVKSRIVAADEHETGARRALNLGHTLGHAFEAESGFTLRHGEAVSLGLVAIARLARARGVDGQPERLAALLARLGLPVDPTPWLARDGIAARTAGDKKASGGKVRVILPGAPGSLFEERLESGEIARGSREFGS